MANIPNPNINVDQYEAAQQETIDTWEAIVQSGVTRSVQRRAAESALSKTATNWEWFRSEWHKKAIGRDATVYRKYLITKVRGFIEESADGKNFLAALDDAHAPIDVQLSRLPGHSKVSKILDPSDGNFTFHDKKQSEQTADRHLIPRYAALPKSLTHDDWLVIGVLVSIRNVLAHSSKRSVDAMNTAIGACHKTGNQTVRALCRDTNHVTLSGVGAYLMAEIQGERRIDRICFHMLGLAQKFRI